MSCKSANPAGGDRGAWQAICSDSCKPVENSHPINQKQASRDALVAAITRSRARTGIAAALRAALSKGRERNIDLDRRLWTVPAERMKADAPHVVPLSDAAMEVMQGLPRFKKGDHLFSTTFAERPINGFSKAKLRLDALMEKLGAASPPFVLHDIRRTVRTRMSAFAPAWARRGRKNIAEGQEGPSNSPSGDSGGYMAAERQTYRGAIVSAIRVQAAGDEHLRGARIEVEGRA
jgi:hypothetical protein